MKRHLIYSFAVVGAAVLGAGALCGGSASAANMTVSTAGEVAGAIAQAGEGDTITFNAGTYDLTTSILINGKDDITLHGEGNVMLRYDGYTDTATPNYREAIRIYDSNDIWLENLTVEASSSTHEADWTMASVGVAINSSCKINLWGMTVKNFGRYGVEVTRLDDGGIHDCAAGDIDFKDSSFLGNNIGIFFTDKDTTPPNAVILGVTFTGTNTFEAGNFTSPSPVFTPNVAIASVIGVDVYGTNSNRLNVGVINASGYLAHCWLAVNGQVALVRAGSVLDDTPVEDFDEETLERDYCLELLDEVTDCPEGLEQDDDGDCLCPDGSEPDEDGNCAPKVCDPNDPTSPGYPCVKVPDTGFVTGAMEMIQSNAVVIAGIGGGAVLGVVLLAGWAKRLHRIKL